MPKALNSGDLVRITNCIFNNSYEIILTGD